MRMLAWAALGLVLANAPMALAQGDIAPTGTLRVTYLATNPAQALRDPITGEVRGASIDLARELGRRIGKPVEFKPSPNPPAVIEAIKSGQADIGFVAYEATRLGTVEFSQTYMLVQQTFLVLDGSPIGKIADIDRDGQKIGGTRNDSPMLCFKRILKRATPVEFENNTAELKRALLAREIDALGSNRQRLTTLMKDTPGSRLLPDNLFDVPQNIIVPMGNAAALTLVNAFIDDIRASGFLRGAIERSGIVGIEAATAGPVSRYGCPG